MEFEFEIGDNEKHKIAFSYDKFWGKLNILVDGKNVVNDIRLASITLTKAYNFKIGEKETHEIRIEKIRPLFLAGLRSNTYKVYVDGKLFKQYKD
jgi:hypothetical protein